MADSSRVTEARRPRVLYVVYWGIAEPLGRSLVLPSVRCLSHLGAEITLLSFEKPGDLARPQEHAQIRSALREHGIEWSPRRYHKRPKWPATLVDVATAAAASIQMHRRHPFDVVHGRTFVGGVMALLISRALRLPLVYHNEGFYPDEQVDGGVWSPGSLPHRLAKALEETLYSEADGIIALSHRAKREIKARPAIRRKETPVIVVPSCVDLSRFSLESAKPPATTDPLRLLYLGSTGGRYRFDQVASFAVAARAVARRVHLTVYTATAPEEVGRQLAGAGLQPTEYSCGYLPHDRIAQEIPKHHAGLFLFTRGLSEHACSPTKIGEYWASGIPVVTTPNVSDTDEIVRDEHVGVLVEAFTQSAFRVAATELLALLADPALRSRCRLAAERHYDLATASQRQIGLYASIRRSSTRG